MFGGAAGRVCGGVRRHLSNTYGSLLNGYTDEESCRSAIIRRRMGIAPCSAASSARSAGHGRAGKVMPAPPQVEQWKVIDVSAVGISVVAIFRASSRPSWPTAGSIDCLNCCARRPRSLRGRVRKQTRQKSAGDPSAAPVCGETMGVESCPVGQHLRIVAKRRGRHSCPGASPGRLRRGHECPASESDRQECLSHRIRKGQGIPLRQSRQTRMSTPP